MSYTAMFSFAFQNLSGATLNAQLYDSSNNTVGSAITTGFYERAGSKGIYTFALSVPDGHQGWCDVYVSGAASTVLATLPLNPAELENADVKTSLVKAKTDNLPSDPADASDIATSFSVVNASLATIAGYIDTEVAAIKAKTDALPAVPAAVSDIPTANDINTALSTVHGAGSWATATGFATPTNVTNTQTAITAAIAALNNLSAGDIDARLAAYDGATQADLDTAKAAVLAAIAALNNLSQAQAQSAAAAALSAYGAATAGNVSSAQTAITTAIGALNNLSATDAAAAIMAYVVSGGRDFQTILLDLWAKEAGNAIANDATNPTHAEYANPNGDVQIAHDMTATTRTVV